MAVIVRPASPGDAAFLAWAVLHAGRAHLAQGWYDIAIGLSEPGCLRLLERLVVTRTPSFWRYPNVMVAEVDGQPAAALSAFGSGDGWGDAQAAMAEAAGPLGWGVVELGAVWARGAYVFSCVFEPDEDCWVIENVAVAPQFRGQGLAGLLIDAALTKGRRLGFKTAQLTFVIGNHPAERAYAKAGFHFAAEKRHPAFQAATGAPGLKRFSRAI